MHKDLAFARAAGTAARRTVCLAHIPKQVIVEGLGLWINRVGALDILRGTGSAGWVDGHCVAVGAVAECDCAG